MNTKFGSSDNLLIFYAGHGKWKESRGQGYWLPKDAHHIKTTNWVSNSDIRDHIKAIPSHHTLLISDACFGGSLINSRDVSNFSITDILAAHNRRSRRAMSSGAKNEAVPDKSKYLEYMLKYLTENRNKHITAKELHSKLVTPVFHNTRPQIKTY